MDAREVLYTTRAMRRLRPDPVPEDVLQRILDAAIRAPCGGNEQSWRFLVVRDRTTLAALGPHYRAALRELYGDAARRFPPGTAQRNYASAVYLAEHFEDIPTCVFGYRASRDPQWDGATMYPALWQICLAARIEGVGSTMTTLLAGPSTAANVDALLGVPSEGGWRQFGMVPLGYPLGRWGVPDRQPVARVAFADRWGNELVLAHGSEERE